MISDMLIQANPIFWVISNLLIVYIGIALVIFVIGYYTIYDPSSTTAGKLIFRFMLSLVGLVFLVFIGVWINPRGGNYWFHYPGDIFWWRPLVRLIVYGYIAYTITSLSVLLGLRKWKPYRLRIAPGEELVKPRHEDY